MLTRRGAHFAARRWYRPSVLAIVAVLCVGIVGAAAAEFRGDGEDDGEATRLSVVTSTAVTTTTLEVTTTTPTPTAGATQGSGGRAGPAGGSTATTARAKSATTAKPAVTATTTRPVPTRPVPVRRTTTTNWYDYCKPHCTGNDRPQSPVDD